MQKRIFFLTVVLLSVLYVKADDYSEWMSRVDDNVYISSKSLFGVPTRDGYRDNAATQNGVVLDYLSTHGGATDSQVTAGYATEPQYIWQIEEPPVDVAVKDVRESSNSTLQGKGKVYDLCGRKVDNQALHHGLYI